MRFGRPMLALLALIPALSACERWDNGVQAGSSDLVSLVQGSWLGACADVLPTPTTPISATQPYASFRKRLVLGAHGSFNLTQTYYIARNCQGALTAAVDAASGTYQAVSEDYLRASISSHTLSVTSGFMADRLNADALCRITTWVMGDERELLGCSFNSITATMDVSYTRHRDSLDASFVSGQASEAFTQGTK